MNGSFDRLELYIMERFHKIKVGGFSSVQADVHFVAQCAKGWILAVKDNRDKNTLSKSINFQKYRR